MVMRYVCLLVALFFSSGLLSQVRIKMKPVKGCFVLPCIVNGLELDMLFDTGTTDMVITEKEAEAMLRNGTLTKEDALGIGELRSADGKLHKSVAFIVREVEVGGIKLKDVRTFVRDVEYPYLVFGMSAIRQLGRIRLEGDELVVLGEEKGVLSGHSDIPGILTDASRCLYNKKYYEAIDLYRKVYDTDPGKMGTRALYELGRAYYMAGDDWQAERFLGKSIRLLEDRGGYEWYIYFWFAKVCYEFEHYGEVMLACQKVLAGDDEISEETEYDIYRMMGLSCSNMNREHEALEWLFEAASLYRRLHESQWPGKNGVDQDPVLGELLYYLGMNFMEDDRWTSIVGFAALCGDEKAKGVCRELQIDWEQYEDPDQMFKELFGEN